MTEVIDYARSMGTSGEVRDVKTSTVLQTCTLLKDMDERALSNTIAVNEQKQSMVKVAPQEQVDDNFMRETNSFAKLTK